MDYTPTGCYEIKHPLLEKATVRLLIKREDLNHRYISGNKWWKLKYNLEAACLHESKRVLTFGGAFSNHIYATAIAAKVYGLESIGIIRGEETLPLNSTLQFAKDQGMKLCYLDRTSYREKNSVSLLKDLQKEFGAFYLLPEGGTNELAVKGCEEFGRSIDRIAADYICLPVGTGGTMAGVIRGITTSKRILGFPVLKGGEFLHDEIQKWTGGINKDRWQLITAYHFGGYGKRNEVVTTFIKDFLNFTGIPLDFVYTGKMMCGIFDLIAKQYFPKETTILAIHTGGLQGCS